MKASLIKVRDLNRNLCGLFILLFSSSILAQVSCPCNNIESSCLCMQPDTLFLTDVKTHGAPVKAVDWLCRGTSDTYAAIGGVQSSIDNRTLRIYHLVNNQLMLIPNIPVFPEDPGATVLSVDWCTIESQGIYLAVAGVPNTVDNGGLPPDNADVRIYKFDPDGSSLDLVASYTHGAEVRSIAWLCDDCNSTSNRYLAIGGQTSAIDNYQVRVLKFDPINETITTVANAFHPEPVPPTPPLPIPVPVYSVDWSACAGRLPILAVGGERSATDNATIRLFTFNCSTMQLQELTHMGGTGARIDAVKMCCDSKGNLYLVAGGLHVGADPTQPNIFYYQLNRNTCMLNLLSTANAPGEVFALDFVPSCDCTHFAVGLGCQEETEPNIIVYEKTSSPTLSQVTSVRFDENITSVKWCKIGDCTYLLVGSEVLGFGLPCVPSSEDEIGLFKGVFCLEPPPAPPVICCVEKQCVRFPTQANLVDTFCWNSVAGAVRYEIYCDSDLKTLLATVLSGQQLCFCKYGVCPTPSTYYLVAIDAAGNKSSVVKVVVS